MPDLELVRLPHDHFGAFRGSIDGVETPDTQMADHDYALGMLVASLSRSRFLGEHPRHRHSRTTLAAQDGADHVDAHRSVLFVAGGHAARAVVSHAVLTTPGALRTIELLLGLPPMSRRDAVAVPITDALSEAADLTPFDAVVPDVLRSTKLPLPPPIANERVAMPRGDARSWDADTAGMDFRREDRLDAPRLQRAALPTARGPLVHRRRDLTKRRR